MHGTDTKTFIWTEECVYWHSSTVKLEETRFGISVTLPQQQGFESYSQARLPVGIDDLTATSTFEEGVIGTAMTHLSHSTAVATPFRGVVGIDSDQSYSLVKTTTLQYLSELEKRHPEDLSVETLVLPAEPLEILDRNISVEFNRQVGDVSHDLSKTILDETELRCLEPREVSAGSLVSFVGGRSKFGTSAHEFLPTMPDVFSEIRLVQDLSIWRKNGDREAFAVHIDSKDVLSLLKNDIIFVQIGDEIPSCGVSYGCAFPTGEKKVLESLVVPVLLDRNSDSSFGVEGKFYEIERLGFEEFGVCLQNVEFHGDVGDLHAFVWLSGNLTQNIQNHAVLEGGVFLAS